MSGYKYGYLAVIIFIILIVLTSDGFLIKYNVGQEFFEDNYYVLDCAYFDVTGDNAKDYVQIIGHKEEPINYPYTDNYFILVEDGLTKLIKKIIPKYNEGYSPRLFLADFNSDKVNDIFIETGTAACGGGGVALYNIISLSNGKLTTIFGDEKISEGLHFRVTFKDNYFVGISSNEVNKEFEVKLPQEFIDYFNDREIYSNGKVNVTRGGGIDPFCFVSPEDVDNDSIYELIASQYVYAWDHVSGLGLVNTTLKYNNASNKWDIIEMTFEEFGDN